MNLALMTEGVIPLWQYPMKQHSLRFFFAGLLLLFALNARATIFYVDANGANPTPPYSDWSTAATNIQDAIDASADDDQILVTNGVYNSGGAVMAGDLTNRVAINKAVTVQSVNGPLLTIIEGAGATNGPAAVRCAWLTNNASLIGFSLVWGATGTNNGTLTALGSGGGVWCASSNATVQNCIIVSNSAFYAGGAAYQGSLKSCFVSGNSVHTSLPGGAIFGASVNNCTVVSNSAIGISQCHSTNSIAYYNYNPSVLQNYSSGNLSYCCTFPGAPGTGNFTSAPQFFTDGIHLATTSPCIGAGTAPASSTDIFGNPWANPPSVGCAEAAATPLVTQPQVRLIGAPIGFNVGNAQLSGVAPFAFAWLKNGTLLQDDGHYSSSQTTNLQATGITFDDAGNYQLIVSNSFGAVTSAIAQVVIHCVDAAGANPTAPYTNWLTAATNIQDAVDAASSNEIVFVTNGVYAAGGKVMSGDLTNRVSLDKPITVLSVNGYASTIIQGQWDPATNGPAAVRCAWLANGATLAGFTLRDGATRGGNFLTFDLQYGGGAWMASNAVVNDCVLTNNAADARGGGVYSGNVFNSYVAYNLAQSGGGAYVAQLNNCTLRENHCFSTSGGAGVENCVSRNCIIAGNYADLYAVFDYQLANYPQTSIDKFTNCCTSPLPPRGSGNISADPVFLDETAFHLAPSSPCRGAGSSLYAIGNDLDNEPFANPPSIGCDEIIDANLTGPLSVRFLSPWTEVLANHYVSYIAQISGRPSELDWSFGDGTVTTNLGFWGPHTWTNVGTYTVTLTVYNHDHPSGVSSNFVVAVNDLLAPSIQPAAGVVSNSFQFSFPGQNHAWYTIQYATNLATPINWQTLQMVFPTNGGPITVQDPAVTNGDTRFYRVQAQ